MMWKGILNWDEMKWTELRKGLKDKGNNSIYTCKKMSRPSADGDCSTDK